MKLQHPNFPTLIKTVDGKAAANKWLKAGQVEVASKGAKKAAAEPKQDNTSS